MHRRGSRPGVREPLGGTPFFVSSSSPTPPPRERADWYEKTSAASVGIEMAVAICIGAFGGKYVQDHWTHWKPWTMLIGLLIGIGAAALAILRVVNEHTAAMKHKAEALAKLASEENSEPSAPTSPPDSSTPHTRRGSETDAPPVRARVQIRTSTLDPAPTATPREDGEVYPPDSSKGVSD